VKVLSLGAVAERSLKFYPMFRSLIPGASSVPVLYQADWDFPVVGRIWGTAGLLMSLFRENRTEPVDVVLLYNCGLPEVIAARMLAAVTGVPVVLEYEDDASHGPDGRRSWRQYCHSLGLRIIRSSIRGVVAASPELRTQFDLANCYVLNGIVGEDLAAVRPVSDFDPRPLRYLFAGSLHLSKGVDTLCVAWAKEELPGCELIIVGEGPLLGPLRAAFGDHPTIQFRGFVPRDHLIELFSQAHVLVNPHRVAGKIGAVFPFKLIEYLGTGRPVISTPMAPLQGSLASGVLYSQSDSAEDLARAMEAVRQNYREWLEKAQTSRGEVWRKYSSEAVCDSVLRILLEAVIKAA
jgi:glycosyltransferase involved in cell wall biosynthesis